METTIGGTLLGAIAAADKARPRSQQKQIGPSGIGGCRRQAWYTINGQEPTNPNTLTLAAWMGTALHQGIEHAMRRQDPWGDRWELEVEVSHDGLTGHVDCYDKETETAWDWKTITRKKAAFFPSQQQRWQVQVYGWLLTQTGRPVKRVGLVGICRDGNERDVIEHSEDYDPEAAVRALAWLAEVEASVEAPAPENDPVSFCADYCPFYGPDTCQGRVGQGAASSPVLDTERAALVAAFVDARAQADEASARLDAAREALVGVAGRTEDGWEVAWSERRSSTVDRDAIRAALGDVPMKQGRASQVLSVKRAKGAA